jgi:hypothetical protein
MALNAYKVLGQVTSGTYEKLPVVDRTLTSNIATVTVGLPSGSGHGMEVGDRFDVSGTDQSSINISGVVSASASSTTFTFPKTASNITSSAQTAAYVYRYSNGLGKAVSNKEKSSGVATLTTSSDHGFNEGDWVTVWINDTAFDGDFIITEVPSSTTFKYIALGSNVSSTADTDGAVSVQPALTVYTAGSGKSAVISTLTVSNSLTHDGYFSAYIVKSGESSTSPADKSIVLNRVTVDPGESYNATLGYTLAAGEKLVVRASHTGMYFNLFGTELS